MTYELCNNPFRKVGNATPRNDRAPNLNSNTDDKFCKLRRCHCLSEEAQLAAAETVNIVLSAQPDEQVRSGSDLAFSSFIVDSDLHGPPSTVGDDFVELFEDVDEMLSVFATCVFYSEVINN